MKKLIYFLIVTSFLVGSAMAQSTPFTKSSIFPQTVLSKEAENSASQAVVFVSAPSNTAEVGTDFTIPAIVTDTTGQDIIAYQFDFHYDPAVIQPQANPIALDGTLSSGMMAAYNPIAPGILKVAVYGAYPLTGAGTLLNFKFKAVGAPGSVSPLTWVNFMFNEGNPTGTAANGQIHLVPKATAIPDTFTGWEVQSSKSFVMVSDDHVNSTSFTVSFELSPTEGEPGCYAIVNGYWTMTAYSNGSYVGMLYGDISSGGVRDLFDSASGATVERRIRTAHFRVLGGKDGYENNLPVGGFDFTSRTKYDESGKTTARLTPIL